MCWVFLKRIPRIRAQWARSSHRPDARPTGKPAQRRHHAVGRHPCKVQPGTFFGTGLWLRRGTGARHRHRYEFNNRYRDIFSQHGMIFSGTSPDDRLVEAVEPRPRHPSMWASSFIRNSNPGPTALTRCSGNLLRQRQADKSSPSFFAWQSQGFFIAFGL